MKVIIWSYFDFRLVCNSFISCSHVVQSEKNIIAITDVPSIQVSCGLGLSFNPHLCVEKDNGRCTLRSQSKTC